MLLYDFLAMFLAIHFISSKISIEKAPKKDKLPLPPKEGVKSCMYKDK